LLTFLVVGFIKQTKYHEISFLPFKDKDRITARPK